MVEETMKKTTWITLGLDTDIAWPHLEYSVSFFDHAIIMLPPSEQLAPSVAIHFGPPMDVLQSRELLNRFLSVLAWVKKRKVNDVGADITNRPNPIRRVRQKRRIAVSTDFSLDYLPEPKDERAQLALALYREAIGVESVPYEFLGYFKVLNIVCKKGEQFKNYIDSILPKIINESERMPIEKRAREHGYDSIGKYMFEAGRCAVAHAWHDPIINPDKVEDKLRLIHDRQLIRKIAEYIIEHEFGVLSEDTYLKQFVTRY